MVAEFAANCAHETPTSSPRNWTCLEIFHAAPIERVAMIKRGMRARWAKAVLGHFMHGCGRDLSALRLSRAAMNRKAALDANLSLQESECVVGIAGLIGQIETMVRESGATEGFDASHWFAGWVISPLPALDGERPIKYLDTWEGRAVVSGLLGQMQSAAYA